MTFVRSTAQTLLAVSGLVAKSVLAVKDRYSALTASGVFLITFLLVHAFGNLSIFLGKDAFNLYGHKLASNPVIKVVEWYLLAAFLLHIVAASYISLKTGKYNTVLRSITSFNFTLPATVMSLTGTMLALFTAVHLQDFRFADLDEVQIGDDMVRDLYTQQHKVLADPKHFIFYIISVLCIALHLLYGWKSAVGRPALGLPPATRTHALLLGYILLSLITLAFLVVAARTHFSTKIYSFSVNV